MLQRPDEIFNEASQTVGDPLERDALGGEAELTGDRAIPRRLVVVSNRLGSIRDLSQAGGLAVGIGDALAERGGLWLGASAEYQDYAASDEPLIRLERVGKIETAALTLPYEEYSLYYNGYANSTLWPLFHYRLDLVNHRAEFLHAYRQINARFAKALAGLLSGNDDLVWVHDYHLIPLAAQLRRLGVRNRIGFFLHIPFPPPDLFVATPDHEELIDDLLQYDVVGFQTETDVGNFRRSVQAANSITFDINGSAEMNGRTVLSRCFPIGIDVDSIARMANEAAEDVQIDSMRRQILGLKQIIGVDRLDYSKVFPAAWRLSRVFWKGIRNTSGRQPICRLRRRRARRSAPMPTSGPSLKQPPARSTEDTRIWLGPRSATSTVPYHALGLLACCALARSDWSRPCVTE